MANVQIKNSLGKVIKFHASYLKQTDLRPNTPLEATVISMTSTRDVMVKVVTTAGELREMVGTTYFRVVEPVQHDRIQSSPLVARSKARTFKGKSIE